MTDNNKTCGNCFFSNTIEVMDPFFGSLSQTETARKIKEDTGIDFTKLLKLRCHYAGAPQVVRKTD